MVKKCLISFPLISSSSVSFLHPPSFHSAEPTLLISLPHLTALPLSPHGTCLFLQVRTQIFPQTCVKLKLMAGEHVGCVNTDIQHVCIYRMLHA